MKRSKTYPPAARVYNRRGRESSLCFIYFYERGISASFMTEESIFGPRIRPGFEMRMKRNTHTLSPLKPRASISGVRSVSKKCSEKPTLQNSCEITHPIADMEKRKCTCNGQWCNSDEELAKQNGARSLNAIDRNKRGNYGRPGSSISTNYLVMLIFMCLFIVGSFSLLIFNTVCVHLC